jgi:hypothetical protein
MAFGRSKEQTQEQAESSGRFVVEHVPVMISGKKFLQQKLDEGDAKGYSLRNLLMSDKHDWILIVWEKPTDSSDE